MNPNDELRQDALTPEVWETVERRLLTKMVAEFAYEEIVTPQPVATEGERSTYRFDLGEASYRFEATERLLDSLHVHEGTVERRTEGTWTTLDDPFRLLRDVGAATDLDGLTEGNLVGEYKRTLLADAHIEARNRARDGFDPTDLEYAHLEGEMVGHPWITYNKGRMGWGYEDYKRYAPERKQPVTLSWLGVRTERSTFAGVEGVTHDSLVGSELGDHHDIFRDRLADRGLDPDAYYLVPVHDWQWDRSIVPLFPDHIAANDIVPLGEGPDEYLPQQSIRTFVNVDSVEKHHVKVPMRIRNTLVWRGLPGERTEAAPTVTEYIKGIYADDEFLQAEGVVLPGEIAGVNYDHDDFTAIDGSPYQYHELLGAIWRESIDTFLEGDERAVTLAALLHVDGDEVPYVSRLVEESGLTVDEWVTDLVETVLPPLLHFLYRYGTVFSPHGQNTILLVENGRPSRLAVKDFVDDVNVSERDLPELVALPDELRDVLRTRGADILCQFIFAGLFVGVFRYLADILEIHEDYAEAEFWRRVREAVLDYQARFPELSDRFEEFDLLRPEFTRLALNRNRLFNYGYDDAPERPHAVQQGTVPNPLHEVGDEPVSF